MEITKRDLDMFRSLAREENWISGEPFELSRFYCWCVGYGMKQKVFAELVDRLLKTNWINYLPDEKKFCITDIKAFDTGKVYTWFPPMNAKPIKVNGEVVYIGG
jgi:hypothetical protein